MSISRSFVLLVVAVSLLLGACTGEPAGKVGIVDLEGVRAQSESVKALEAYLETVREGMLTEAMAADEAYKNDPSEANEQALEVAMTRFQEVLAAEEQRLSMELTEVLRTTFDGYREENGFAALLFKDAVLSYDPELDVTVGIVAALDKKGIDIPTTTPVQALSEQDAGQADEQAQ